MLDVFYPSLYSLIAACREIRRCLRDPQFSHLGNPADYNLRRVLPMFLERVRFIDGSPQVVYIHPTFEFPVTH